MRTTKTGSGNTAVQVVERGSHRIKVVKHIGTADDNTKLQELLEKGQRYIMQATKITPLFPEMFNAKRNQAVSIDDLEFTNTYHSFAYEFLSYFYGLLGFGAIANELLKDLAIIRIIESSSKLHALVLLKKYFERQYGKTIMYEKLPKMKPLKIEIEKQAVCYAKNYLSFDFSLVFYDVTTLYFESFTQDADDVDEKGNILTKGLRKNGFSKDNKSNQPQIVIGLIVTREGFPVSYDVFEGNTFEGGTFIPSITKFKDTHEVKTLTVIADAAMISFDNVQELVNAKLSYIVGARTANLKPSRIEKISTELIGNTKDLLELAKRDGTSTRIETDRGLLVCDFSIRRYRKDKREMEKQIAKAQKLLDENKALTRTKFIKTEKTNQTLNADLVEKTKLLLGIKGYYTNLTEVDNQTIISHYHNLWHVEKAFRIAKSDLEARPIFHHKRDSIEVHILIVFVSLCVSKAIELLTNYSIKKVRDMIWEILDIEFTDTFTKRVYRKRMAGKTNEMVKLLTDLRLKEI